MCPSPHPPCPRSLPGLERRTFQPGEFLVREGEEGDAAFFVLKGKAMVLKLAPDDFFKGIDVENAGTGASGQGEGRRGSEVVVVWMGGCACTAATAVHLHIVRWHAWWRAAAESHPTQRSHRPSRACPARPCSQQRSVPFGWRPPVPDVPRDYVHGQLRTRGAPPGQWRCYAGGRRRRSPVADVFAVPRLHGTRTGV